MVVVFPRRSVPKRPELLPLSTRKVTRSIAVRCPYRFVMLRTSIMQSEPTAGWVSPVDC